MNDIDNLLEKYFNGTSTAEEEQSLKKYFRGANVSPQHETYEPLFARFEREKQVKAPEIIIPEKRLKNLSVTRRIILLAATSAVAVLLVVSLSILHRKDPQQAEYVVIVNGKQVTNSSKAQKYAEEMFGETEKMVESAYRPYREATYIKTELNADKILLETDRKIESIKTIHQ